MRDHQKNLAVTRSTCPCLRCSPVEAAQLPVSQPSLPRVLSASVDFVSRQSCWRRRLVFSCLQSSSLLPSQADCGKRSWMATSTFRYELLMLAIVLAFGEHMTTLTSVMVLC